MDLLHLVGHHVITKGLCITLWRAPWEELNTHISSLLFSGRKWEAALGIAEAET